MLGISADASASDIHKAAARARRALSLGLDEISEADLSKLGPCLRTEATIRTALGQLMNPDERLVHRLFWFHSKASKASNEVFEQHDLCLAKLVELAGADSENFEPNDWANTLLDLSKFLSRDDYWELTTELEINGSFEPPAYSSEVDNLRDTAVGIAAEPLLTFAREAAHSEDLNSLSRALSALEQLDGTGRWASVAQRELSQPILDKFNSLCSSLQSEVSDGIVRDADSVKQNKIVCVGGIKRFKTEISPQLDTLTGVFKLTPWLVVALKEPAAQCLGTIGMGYTWADDFVTAQETYQAALEIAEGTLAAPGLHQSLEEIHHAASQQKSNGQPVDKAPSLSTINGIGFALYGRSDEDFDTGQYTTTHYFVVFFVPVFPLGRYRVLRRDSQGYRFFGKLPFRKYEKWHLGIALLITAALLIMGNLENSEDPTSTEGAMEAVDDSSSAPDEIIVNGSAASSGREAILAEINAGRARVAELEASLAPYDTRMKTLNEQLDEIKQELDALDASKASGDLLDEDRYNSLVGSFNSISAEQRSLANENKPLIDEYNKLIDRDKEMVAEYNATEGAP